MHITRLIRLEKTSQPFKNILLSRRKGDELVIEDT